LQARLVQLSPYAHGQQAADHQHRESEQQIQRTNVLVVGRKDPAAPARGGVMLVVMSMIVMV
jgi:hypothetical protein